MTIKTLLTTSEENGTITFDEGEILPTLGSGSENLAIQLEELFTSVSEAVAGTLKTEGQLTIEVSGTVSLKASGGLKYLFFNVSGERASSSMMKVVLTTPIRPRDP